MQAMTMAVAVAVTMMMMTGNHDLNGENSEITMMGSQATMKQ